MTSLRQIADVQSHVEELEDRFLREQGWKQTCDTPGHLWVWSISLPDGRVILTSKTQALAFASVMERSIDRAVADDSIREWDRELDEDRRQPARRTG